MGFGAEMKDFVAGFKVGTQFWDDVEDSRDRKAKRDSKRAPTDEDLAGQPGMPSGTNKVSEGAPSSGYDYSDINIEDDPEAAKVLGFIRQHEGGDDPYNKLVGGSKKRLEVMSVQEVLDYQKQMIAEGKESTALGAYQFINPTLTGLVKELNIDPLTPFDQATQDQLGYALLQRRGWNEYKDGKISKDKFLNNLAGEWAALPLQNGKSAYEGVGSNKAGVDRDTFASAVPDFGGGSTQVAEADTEPKSAIPAPSAAAPKPAKPAAAAPVQQAVPTVTPPAYEAVEEPTEVVEEEVPEGEEGFITGQLEDQRVYGGLPTGPVAEQWARPVLAAAEGGAIPAPKQVDPYNAGRDVTVIAASTPKANAFVPRRVGTPPPAATAPVGPSASQQKFRDMRAQQAIPAPAPAPAQTNNPFGWGPKEGNAPTLTAFKPGQLDQYDDNTLRQQVANVYAGVQNEGRGQQLNAQQKNELLQYSRWRLGQQGYDQALSNVGRVREQQAERRRNRGGGRMDYAEGGAVPGVDEEEVTRTVRPPTSGSALPVRAAAGVNDEMIAPAARTAQPSPQQGALPVRGAAAPGDQQVAGPAETEQPDRPSNPRTRDVVARALDGGIKFLTQTFGLSSPGAVPTPNDGANREAGARRFAEGEGAATRDEIAAIDSKIDPQGQMSEGDRQMQRLSKTVQWYSEQGRPKEAAAAAASLMQYGATKFGQLGSLASAAYGQYLKTKDPSHLDATIKFLDKAYEMVPDGASFDIAINPETHTIQATRTDADGDTEVTDVKPEELAGILQKVQDKSLYWKSIYAIADPAGARQKASSAATAERTAANRKATAERSAATQAALDKRTAATQSAQDRRAAANQEAQDRRAAAQQDRLDQREQKRAAAAEEREAKRAQAIAEREAKRAEREEKKAEEAAKRNKVDFASFKSELSAAEAAKKSLDADEDGAQDTLNEAASRLFDKLPETKDRMKIMADMGFGEEVWDYVDQPADQGPAVASPPAAPAEPEYEQPFALGGARVPKKPAAKAAPSGAYTGNTAPPSHPDAKRAKDGAWYFKTPDGKWAVVTG